jgi:N-acyl-D-aspartate/D-glutamate deacylase
VEIQLVTIYILIEHQLEPDRLMVLRELEYVVQIHKSQAREWDQHDRSFAGLHLQPVHPVVFHTGNRRWHSLGRLKELVEMGERFAAVIPGFEPIFLNLAILAGLLLTNAGGFAGEAPYDLVIRNGKIVDGTGNPWFRGDVAIRGDRIVAVGRVPSAPAKREIDARGLVVAPGFIDMHSHSDYLLLEDGNAQSKVRQGVTTEVLGEGISAGPDQGKRPPRSALVGGKTERWTSLAGYFDIVQRAGVSVNIASYVGMDNVWQSVMGDLFDRPTADQLKQVKSLVDEAMKDGACGLSTMLAMPPGSLATTEDLVELCKVVARHRGIYSSHIRNEGTGVIEAVKEAITIGQRADVPVDIIHLKIADKKLWGHMNDLVDLIEDARKHGVDVQANVYPYTRGNNNLASIIPPWAHEGGNSKMLERLKDPKQRDRLKKEIREGLPGWYDHYTAVGGDWGRMLVSGKGNYEGLTMDRVIAARSEGKDPRPDPFDVLFDVLIEEGGSVPTIYEHHTEKDMRLALAQTWCSIGSDGSAYAVEGPLRRGNPHPRSFGTFPRVLGIYVRETGLLRLEDAVRKMTSLNAAKIGITDRGSLRAGNYADVVVFDPERIIDRATYEKPFQYGDGIVHVIVNGTSVLQEGKHTEERPGRVLRHAK